MVVVVVGLATGSAALLAVLIGSLRRVVAADPACHVIAGPGDEISSEQAATVLTRLDAAA